MAVRDCFENQAAGFAVGEERQLTIGDLEDVMPEPEWKANPDEPYQVMRPLTDEERESLKAHIQQHGVSQPIEVDEEGNILDGHNRFHICQEIGIPCPIKVVSHLKTPQEKRDYARGINCARRSPGIEERKRQAEEMLLEDASRSNRSISKVVGISDPTVGAIRKRLVDSAKISHVVEEIEATEPEKPKFPFLESDAWKQWHKMEALHLLAKLDDEEQAIINEIMAERARDPKDCLRMIETAANFTPAHQARFKELWASKTPRRRSLVISRLSGGMPQPDPRIPILAGAIQEVRRVVSDSNGKGDTTPLVKATDLLRDYVQGIQAQEEVW